MKVVHVMTSTAGGAGIAATRIHNAQRAAGIESSILCLARPDGIDPDVHQFPTRFPTIAERVALKAGIRLSNGDKASHRLGTLGVTGLSFSEPVSDHDILAHPLVRDADVINLHWVGGFLDWRSFFERVKKPVAWTLHDLNPLLGGFHFRTDRERSPERARQLDDSLAIEKSRILNGFRRLHVIGPSRWIADESKRSSTLGRFTHSVIPYPIDVSGWRRTDRVHAREVFGLDTSGKLVLTVSERAGDMRKGGDILQKAFARPDIAARFAWAAVGAPSDGFREARALGFLSDHRLIALAYSAADFFVLPSREDNLPNVVMESLAIGTPVVALPVGGVPGMIDDGVNGVLARAADSDSLADALAHADGIAFDSGSIRAAASATYDPASIAASYRSVYESLLS
jgi:glycosyltransferase involved in cell wall biosynthesis